MIYPTRMRLSTAKTGTFLWLCKERQWVTFMSYDVLSSTLTFNWNGEHKWFVRDSGVGTDGSQLIVVSSDRYVRPHSLEWDLELEKTIMYNIGEFGCEQDIWITHNLQIGHDFKFTEEDYNNKFEQLLVQGKLVKENGRILRWRQR
jgi:hypothetical protein